jgi:hypothetical protein
MRPSLYVGICVFPVPDLHPCCLHWFPITGCKNVVLFCTVRSESRCALRLPYVDLVFVLVFVSTLVGITFNTLCKCTATSRMQICRKCLRIQLNGFRLVKTLVDITSNNFYKCTAAFLTQCSTMYRLA